MINIRKLEAELWESADLLRQGSKLTSSQYCMPVLALLFLRYAYSRYKMVEAEILQYRPVRGGGGGIEALDEIQVLQTVSVMATPVICAIGHVGEELFMKPIADKVAPTPNGLGQYFSEMVERVVAKRNNSRAALIKEVEGQFKKQIEDSNKKNKELNEQLEKMTKAQKAQAEQMGKLQGQMKAQTEASAKQSKEFNESLKKMQDTYTELNKSLQKLTAQNTQAAKDLNEAKERQRQLEKQLEEALSKNKGYSSGCLGMVAAIVTVASAACWIVCLIL